MDRGEYIRTPEMRAKISKRMMGHGVSKETRKKIGEAATRFLTGKKRKSFTAEHREAIGRASRYNLWNHEGLTLSLSKSRAYVRIFTGWLPRSHAVWIQANGPIPEPGIGKKSNEYCVHHKDENKLNDLLDNLQLMTITEHALYHNRK